MNFYQTSFVKKLGMVDKLIIGIKLNQVPRRRLPMRQVLCRGQNRKSFHKASKTRSSIGNTSALSIPIKEIWT